MLDIIKKHIADFSASNWNDYKAVAAPDIIYVEAATSSRVQGVDDYLKAVQKWKRAFPDVKGKVIGGITSGDQVTAEIECGGHAYRSARRADGNDRTDEQEGAR